MMSFMALSLRSKRSLTVCVFVCDNDGIEKKPLLEEETIVVDVEKNSEKMN